jgi:hypothetical protein
MEKNSLTLKTTILVSGLVLCIGLITACGGGLKSKSTDLGSPPDDNGLLGKSTSSRSVDPKKAAIGHNYMANMSDGMPFFNAFVLRELPSVWDEKDKSQVETLSEDERVKKIYDYYGLEKSPYNPDVPIGFNKNAQGNFVVNCAACHAGSVQGKVILGLGNTRLDEQLFFDDIAKTRMILAEQKKDPVGLLPPQFVAQPPNPDENIPSMSNDAYFTTLSLMALRNDDLSIRPFDQMLDLGPMRHMPVDVPVWWNMKKKDRLYMANESTYKPRTLMQFFIGMFNMQKPEFEALEPMFENVVHFIDSINHREVLPPYPGPIDQRLAANGKAVFVESCARCHGTYDSENNWRYPERVVDFESVKTDTAFHAASYPGNKFMKHMEKSWFNFGGKDGGVIYGVSKGILAPPLDGIWATAPYLHNGSVPTLAQMLGVKPRSKVWRIVDYDRVDENEVGLKIESVSSIPEGLSRRDRRQYYDTSRYGSGNQGHDYPMELSLPKRFAVLEYLKTL